MVRPPCTCYSCLLCRAALRRCRPPAQDANVGALSGTLKKIKDTGTITLGYRENSLPFSYLNKRQQPIGYSIDLCREIVEESGGRAQRHGHQDRPWPQSPPPIASTR